MKDSYCECTYVTIMIMMMVSATTISDDFSVVFNDKSIILILTQLRPTTYQTILYHFDVFLTVHHSIELFHLPTLKHNSLFINNMYVTLLTSTCFEH